MPELLFVGSGDAFGSGGRFNTCFRLTTTASTCLIDCGASSLVAMRRAAVEPNSISTILISHLHGDHFGALPFFLLDGQFISHRTAKLTIAGPPGLRERLDAAREVFFPGSSKIDLHYPLEVRELEPERASRLDDLVVTPFVVEHPSGAPPFALRIEADGRSLCYSGDSAWVPGLERAARGVDLLVIELYAYRDPVPYHIDLPTLRRFLPTVRAKRVVLTHMGDEMLDHQDEVGLETAEDGLLVRY